MTVTEAADVWEKSKREIDRLRPKVEAAAEVLKEHFRKTGRSHYRGRIGFAVTSRVTLDQAKVKAELGDRLERFQKRTQAEQLSLLK